MKHQAWFNEPVYRKVQTFLFHFCCLWLSENLFGMLSVDFLWPFNVHFRSSLCPFPVLSVSIRCPFVVHSLSIRCPFCVNSVSIPCPCCVYYVSIPCPFRFHSMSIPCPFLVHSLSTPFSFHVHSMSIPFPFHSVASLSEKGNRKPAKKIFWNQKRKRMGSDTTLSTIVHQVMLHLAGKFMFLVGV